MPRMILLCAGICLSGATEIAAQNLPKSPTAQQVVGYRVTEQQQWNSQQVPKNSVLFKSGKKYPGSQSFQFSFKKEKPAVVDLSIVKPPSSQGFAVPDATAQQTTLLKKSVQKKKLYSQWQKNNWLKEVKQSKLSKESSNF